MKLAPPVALFVLVFAGCTGSISSPFEGGAVIVPPGCEGADCQPIACVGDCVGESTLPRLTRDQYRNTVHSLWGEQIAVNVEELPTDHTAGGFASNAAVGVSSDDVDRYTAVAQAIADQISPDDILDCPAQDASCAAQLTEVLTLHHRDSRLPLMAWPSRRAPHHRARRALTRNRC